MQGSRALGKITCLLILFLPASLSSSQLKCIDVIGKINPKLSLQTRQEIASAVNRYAYVYDVDARLVFAVIAVESRFNPRAKGSVGEVGLMQLNPRYFSVSFDIDKNVEIGVKYISLLQRSSVYTDYKWLEHYNRGLYANATQFKYTKKVLKYFELFRPHLAL